MDIDKASHIANRHFGETPQSIRRIDIGVMTSKFDLDFNDNHYILRVFPTQRSYIAAHEFDILKVAHAARCKVPEVCWQDHFGNQSYIIYNKLEGIDLQEAYERLGHSAYAQIIDEIALNFHSLSCLPNERFGNLNEPQHQFDDWASFLMSNIAEGKENLAKSRYKDSLEVTVIHDFLEAAVAKIPPIKASLVWSDFSTENIITDGKKLSGFIDFESCFWGDPCMAIGYLFAREGNSVFFNLLSSKLSQYFDYEHERIIFYALIRILRIIKYDSEPLPNGEKRADLFSYFKGASECINFVSNYYDKQCQPHRPSKYL
jgi:aminoglycoside phosphotransferase (APT) family kinase protein